MTGNVYVDAISEIAFEGNIIPWSWYKTLRLPSHKPDLVAIMILADVVYWYRPAPIHDERTGEVLGWKKKFSADLLQRSHDAYVTQFGFTQQQVKDALYRLESIYGVIRRERRTITTAGHGRMGNVLFIAPIIEAIRTITHPRPLASRNPKLRRPRPQGRGVDTLSSTEISSETSPKISHKCLTDSISVGAGAKSPKTAPTHRRSQPAVEWTGHYVELPDDLNWPLIAHCLDDYYAAYIDRYSRQHPKLKRDQLVRRETILSDAFDRHEIDCAEDVTLLVDTYWARSFVKRDKKTRATDGNLNAFATVKNLNLLAAQLGWAGVDEELLPVNSQGDL